MRPIDADALMELARNDVRRVVDCNDIARFPTIDVAPVVHGQWVHFNPHNPNAVLCSVCDYAFARLHPENYCPNCGAKMDAKE